MCRRSSMPPGLFEGDVSLATSSCVTSEHPRFDARPHDQPGARWPLTIRAHHIRIYDKVGYRPRVLPAQSRYSGAVDRRTLTPMEQDEMRVTPSWIYSIDRTKPRA